MVAKALSGEFGAYDCPAGMVDAAVDTLWFTDTEGVAEFEALQMEDEDEEESSEEEEIEEEEEESAIFSFWKSY